MQPKRMHLQNLRVVDEIAAKSGLETKDVLAVLTTLEVKGYAYSCSGSRYGLLNK